MSTYFLAPALVTLRDEINERFPKRDKTSDGWIGDPSHAARVSDHNPDWNAPEPYTGVVRAIDVDVDDNDPNHDLRKEILNACIGDPRVWYVISNGIIYSRTHGWRALTYTGENGHYHHVHISLMHFAGEFVTDAWFDPAPLKVKNRPVSLSHVREQFLAARDGKEVTVNNGVARIQNQLRHRFKEDLAVDGLAGKATLDAWGRYEKRTGVQGGARIPDFKTLARLAQGRFEVVK